MQPNEPILLSPCELDLLTDRDIKLLLAMRVIYLDQLYKPKHGVHLGPMEFRAYFSTISEMGQLTGGFALRVLDQWIEDQIFLLSKRKVENDKYTYWTLAPMPPQDGPRLITATEAAYYDRRCLRVLAYARLLNEPSIPLIGGCVGQCANVVAEKVSRLSRVLTLTRDRKIKHKKYL